MRQTRKETQLRATAKSRVRCVGRILWSMMSSRKSEKCWELDLGGMVENGQNRFHGWRYDLGILIYEFRICNRISSISCRQFRPRLMSSINPPPDRRLYSKSREEPGRLRVAAHNLAEPMAVRPRVFHSQTAAKLLARRARARPTFHSTRRSTDDRFVRPVRAGRVRSTRRFCVLGRCRLAPTRRGLRCR
jgi:hypothetical protein